MREPNYMRLFVVASGNEIIEIEARSSLEAGHLAIGKGYKLSDVTDTGKRVHSRRLRFSKPKPVIEICERRPTFVKFAFT